MRVEGRQTHKYVFTTVYQMFWTDIEVYVKTFEHRFTRFFYTTIASDIIIFPLRVIQELNHLSFPSHCFTVYFIELLFVIFASFISECVCVVCGMVFI